MSRIQSIEVIDDEVMMADLEVEEAHCFYANNILIHNCAEELYCMANVAPEPVWLDAIRDGVDLHNATARSAFKLSPEVHVDKNLRKQAKTCYSTDSYALTSFGWSKMTNLDGLLSVDKELQYYICSIEHRKGYKLTLSNGQVLKVSEHHPFRVYDTLDPKYVEVEDIKGHQLGLLRGTEYPTEIFTYHKYQLGEGFKSQTYHGSVYLDESLAYVLGLYLGDGHLEWYKKDRNRPEQIVLVTQKSNTGFVVHTLSKFGNVRVKEYKNYNKISLCSASLASLVINLCGSTKTKHVPEQIITSKMSVRLAMIAGLVDSDGTITKSTVKYLSTNKDLFDSVAELVALTGIYAWVTSQPAKYKGKEYGTCYTLNMKECQNIPLLVQHKLKKLIDGNFTYNMEGYRVEREKLMSRKGDTQNYVLGRCRGLSIQSPSLSEEHRKYYPIEVVKIEPWEGEVSVLSTETHEFIAEGQRSHNCNFALGYALPGSYWPLIDAVGSQEAAIELEQNYRAGLPNLYQWKNKVYAQARMQGYVVNPLGHCRSVRRYLESRTKKSIEYAQKTGVSHMIQGMCGVIMRIVMVKLWKKLVGPDRVYNKDYDYTIPSKERTELPEAWLFWTVHDEAIVCCKKEIAVDIAHLVSEAMTSTTPPNFVEKLKAEPEVGPDLGHLVPMKFEVVAGVERLVPAEEDRPKQVREEEVDIPDVMDPEEDDTSTESFGGFEF